MSFYLNSRALFPTTVGPTLFYSAPYASSPFGWSGASFGPRVLLAQKRPFSNFLDEQLLDGLFDALNEFPPSKYSRSEDSSDEEDNMDLEEECDCGDDQCDCGDECDCGDDEVDAKNEDPAIISDDKASDSLAVTKTPEKSNEVIAKPESSSVSVFKSFFNDEQNFKVDDTDDLVTVTSSWNGFNKGDLNVDFKDGSLIVSGKSEGESKDEKSGTVSKSFKSVSKTIRLPDNIDKEKISAKFKDDGFLLTISVPKVKKPEKEVETIVIN
jgi:HSP20 family molecular chaperone IbpA